MRPSSSATTSGHCRRGSPAGVSFHRRKGDFGMSRISTLVFAIVAYAIFFATFLYLIVFVGDFPLGTKTVDVGPTAAVGVAVVIDVFLIALFGLQHSVM